MNGKGKYGVGIAAYAPGRRQQHPDHELRVGHRRLRRHSGRERDRHQRSSTAARSPRTRSSPSASMAARRYDLQRGHITGFVQLDADDLFVNQKGGVFETKLTSDFDASGTGGDDLFRNEQGGTVLAATDPNDEGAQLVRQSRAVRECQASSPCRTAQVGDSFEISNTVGEQRPRVRRLAASRRLRSMRFWAGPARRRTFSSSTATCQRQDRGRCEQHQCRARRVQRRAASPWSMSIATEREGRRVLPVAADRHRVLQLRSVLQADRQRHLRARARSWAPAPSCCRS